MSGLEIFYYCVYGILGIIALRFVFWEMPQHFQLYWVGVLSSAAGLAVLVGMGVLIQWNGVVAFFIGAIALFLCARLIPVLTEWTGIKKK